MAALYDIAIVGGGLAGLTAGLFAARDRCRAVLFESIAAGGQVLNCEHIENFPGFPRGVAGYELGPVVQQQATGLGLEVKSGEVHGVTRDGDAFLLSTDAGPVRARTLIVASGSTFARLEVPGEDAFAGKGVSHCAPCDGALFQGKPVAVVGGGDAAADEAAYLTRYASRVTLIHRRDRLRACSMLDERVRAQAKVEFRWNTVVRAIDGGDGVDRVQIEDVKTGERGTIEVAGVFIYAGLAPSTAFLGGMVPLDPRGRIATDLSMRTPVPGVLAAGDVRQDSARQLVASAGDGATAALAAVHYLRTGEWLSAIPSG